MLSSSFFSQTVIQLNVTPLPVPDWGTSEEALGGGPLSQRVKSTGVQSLLHVPDLHVTFLVMMQPC